MGTVHRPKLCTYPVCRVVECLVVFKCGAVIFMCDLSIPDDGQTVEQPPKYLIIWCRYSFGNARTPTHYTHLFSLCRSTLCCALQFCNLPFWKRRHWCSSCFVVSFAVCCKNHDEFYRFYGSVTLLVPRGPFSNGLMEFAVQQHGGYKALSLGNCLFFYPIWEMAAAVFVRLLFFCGWWWERVLYPLAAWCVATHQFESFIPYTLYIYCKYRRQWWSSLRWFSTIFFCLFCMNRIIMIDVLVSSMSNSFVVSLCMLWCCKSVNCHLGDLLFKKLKSVPSCHALCVYVGDDVAALRGPYWYSFILDRWNIILLSSCIVSSSPTLSLYIFCCQNVHQLINSKQTQVIWPGRRVSNVRPVFYV